jgi:hypothetical protein
VRKDEVNIEEKGYIYSKWNNYVLHCLGQRRIGEWICELNSRFRCVSRMENQWWKMIDAKGGLND